MAYLVPDGKSHYRFPYFIRHRHSLLQSGRICHNYKRSAAIFHDFSYGRCPLDSERSLVIALFKSLSRIRHEEHAVSLNQIIQVNRTIFSRLPVRKHDDLNALIRKLGYDEPSGRQEEPAAEHIG